MGYNTKNMKNDRHYGLPEGTNTSFDHTDLIPG
jgi:hypothetical protein